MTVCGEAAGLMTVSYVAPGERRDTRIRRYLVKSLSVLNGFRHELASEPDAVRRRKNAYTVSRLDSLIHLLMEHGEDAEYVDPADTAP